MTNNLKDFCTNEQIINKTQEIPKEDIANDNAKKQTSKAKGKKPENVENTTENKTEKVTEKKAESSQAKNPMDFEKKLKSVKDHLKNKSRENNEK